MRRRTTLIRVTLAAAIFLGLQAGLCTAACAVAAGEATAEVPRMERGCHASGHAEARTDAQTAKASETGTGVHSLPEKAGSCCAALANTGAAEGASISSSSPLEVAAPPGTRIASRPATLDRSRCGSRPIPPPDILLLNTTLLL